MRYIFRGPSATGEGGDRQTVSKPDPNEVRVQAQAQIQAIAMQEEFQKTILADASEVASKAINSSNSQIRQILIEVVEQSGQFWSTQMHKAASISSAALQDLRQQLASAQEGAAEAHRRHEQESTELKRQLDLAQDTLASEEASHVREAARLQERIHSAENTLEETTRTYKGLLQDLNKQVHSANEVAHEAGLKAQQRRMVMLQTSEAQRREIDELKAALEQEKAHSTALDERAKKLTQLSQHLLAKQSKNVAAAAAAAAHIAPRRASAASPPEARAPPHAAPSAAPGVTEGPTPSGPPTSVAPTHKDGAESAPAGFGAELRHQSMNEAEMLAVMNFMRTSDSAASTPPQSQSAASTPPHSPRSGPIPAVGNGGVARAVERTPARNAVQGAVLPAGAALSSPLASSSGAAAAAASSQQRGSPTADSPF